MNHNLKSWDSFFQAVWDGKKNFEIRINDRGFNAGDRVSLHEIEQTVSGNWFSTGRKIFAKISYVTGFQQQAGWVVFGLRSITRHDQ